MNKSEFDHALAKLQAQLQAREISLDEYTDRVTALDRQRGSADRSRMESTGTAPHFFLQRGMHVGSQSRRFQLLEPIGRGSYGAVWLAHDCDSGNRQVALKFLNSILTGNRADADALKDEALKAQALQHPGIVRIFDWYRDEFQARSPNDGDYFFAMEYLQGQSLKEFVLNRYQAGNPVGVDEAITLLQSVADALRYAWEHHQLLHRDVKEDNIFITTKGRVVLVDFGIAAKAADQRNTLTVIQREGIDQSLGVRYLLGTRSHLAPESASARRETPYRDGYALAVTAYYVLDGERLPFNDLRTSVDPEMPQSLEAKTDIKPDVREAIWTALRAGFAYEQSKRPNSAWAFMETLAAATKSTINVDAQLWSNVCAADDEAGYKRYLNEQPTGAFHGEAATRLRRLVDAQQAKQAAQADVKAWHDATVADTEAAYERYLSQQTAGAFQNDAKSELSRLFAARKAEQGKRDADEQAWQIAKTEGSEAAYDRYLDQQTEGLYRGEAVEKRNALAQVRRAAVELADEKRWKEALQANTDAAYDRYLREHKDGRYRVDALAKKKEAGNARRDAEAAQRKDEQLWKEAANANTEAAYQSYLNLQKDGQYRIEAVSRNKALASERRRALDESRAPDDRLWKEATDADTESSYERYLNASVNRAHEVEAISRRNARRDGRLAAQNAEVDVDAWLNAKKLHTVESYGEYLTRFPMGAYFATGISLQSSLRRQRAKEAENDDRQKPVENSPAADLEAWAWARKLNSFVAYREYLSKFPNGRYAALAVSAQDALRKATNTPEKKQPKNSEAAILSASQDEEFYFRVATRKKTLADCDIYLKRCPQGRRAADIAALRARLVSATALDESQQANSRTVSFDQDFCIALSYCLMVPLLFVRLYLGNGLPEINLGFILGCLGLAALVSVWLTEQSKTFPKLGRTWLLAAGYGLLPAALTTMAPFDSGLSPWRLLWSDAYTTRVTLLCAAGVCVFVGYRSLRQANMELWRGSIQKSDLATWSWCLIWFLVVALTYQSMLTSPPS